jgi:hypothetical protein
MEDKDVININPADTPDEAKARHERILSRLDDLGAAAVKQMHASGGLPTHWNPIIHRWLKDK